MDWALDSIVSNNSVAESHDVATGSSKRTYVSESYQWDELQDIFVMLWPGMALDQLMAVMEEDYGFRATKDQYKKKFKDWYKRGILAPKKRRKGQKTQEEKPKELEDDHKMQDAIVEPQHRLPTPASTPDRDETMSLVGPVIDHGTPSHADTLVCMQDQPAPPYSADVSHRRRSSVLGTARQITFHQLLSDLWDTYFDAEFGHADQVEVGEAVRNMIEFLLNVAATDESWSTVTTHPGDLKLLRRVVALIRNCCPADEDLWERLEAAVSPGRDRSIRLGYTGSEWRFFYTTDDTPTWNGLLQQTGGSRSHSVHATYVIYCCQCGDGPYNQAVSIGCARLECTGHRFCLTCVVLRLW